MGECMKQDKSMKECAEFYRGLSEAQKEVYKGKASL